MSKLAIIPARGGSKRIPKKNVKDFCGKPIIEYSIKACLDSGLFDEVMVSTDDEAIAKKALECGAKVPFSRTNETANDYATLSDVLVEVIGEYHKQGKSFKYFACVLPTAPFITHYNLKEAFTCLEKNNYTSVFPVLRYTYPIQRALQVDTSKKVSMVWPENMNSRSQDLQPSYHDAGQFYVVKTEGFLQEKVLFTNNSGMIELSEMEVQDIDTEQDWEIAEFKFKLKNKYQ